MELRHLRHFSALARVGHFSQAANSLNLAQPSLSRSIQKLELSLGVNLLDRNARHVTLTPFGELVLKHSEAILDSAENMRHQIDKLKESDQGLITIAATPSVSDSLAKAIGGWITQRPHREIELRIEPLTALLSAMENKELGLLLTDATHQLPSRLKNEWQVRAIGHQQAYIYCRAGHPLSKKPQGSNTQSRVTLADLQPFALALPRKIPAQVQRSYHSLLARPRQDFSGVIRYDSFNVIRHSLLASDMVALTTEAELEQNIHEVSLGFTRLWPIDIEQSAQRLQIWHRKDISDSTLMPLIRLLEQEG